MFFTEIEYNYQRKGDICMKSQKKNYSNILKGIAKRTLSFDANSTTCIMLYQPKVPASLKNYSNLKNDK